MRQLMTNNCSNSTKVNNPEGDKMEKEDKEKELQVKWSFFTHVEHPALNPIPRGLIGSLWSICEQGPLAKLKKYN